MSVCIVSASATVCLYGSTCDETRISVLLFLSLVICPLVHFMFVSPIKLIFASFWHFEPLVLNKKITFFFTCPILTNSACRASSFLRADLGDSGSTSLKERRFNMFWGEKGT